MYLKLMSDMPANAEENLPDSDGRKPYQIIECDQAQFFRDDDLVPHVEVSRHGLTVEIIKLEGNAYLMNDKGNTIATASPNKLKQRKSTPIIDVKVTGSIDPLRGSGRTSKAIAEAAKRAQNGEHVVYVSKNENQSIAHWRTAQYVVDPASFAELTRHTMHFAGNKGGTLQFTSKSEIADIDKSQLVFDHYQ